VEQKACELILDTMGVGINGSVHREGRPVLETVLEAGGTAEATIWGHPQKVPTHAAALVNGTFTHCIEMDDTHRTTYLHAGAFVLIIRNQAGFDPSLVESVEVYGSKQLYDQTGNQRPETVMAAQLSTPFSVALSLATGGTMPEDVEEGLKDPDVLDLVRRITVVVDSGLPATARDITLRVKLKSGEEKTVSVTLPLGEPETPIPPDMLRDKFLYLSSPVLGRMSAEHLYQTLLNIGGMDSIQTLSRELVPAEP
jgi:2-methylcitrate dehydratase PrpD